MLNVFIFESAFGICIGCKIYHLFKKETMYCAGGCDAAVLDRVAFFQLFIVLATVAALAFGSKYFNISEDTANGWQSKITQPQALEPCEHMDSDMYDTNYMRNEHMNHGMRNKQKAIFLYNYDINNN